MDDLLVDFLTETNESLAELDVALVRLERTPDDQLTLSLIFRLVHTIKGTCGFLGLPRLERVAHAAENVLGRVRDGELAATSAIVSAVLAALDRIKEIMAGLAEAGAEPAGADDALIGALDTAAAGREATAPSRDTDLPLAEPPLGEVTTPAPREGADAVVAGQTIRVGVDVLEDLMTLVSELVLTRNQLLQLARNEQNSAFAVPLQRLSHITTDLQEGVMKTRMQPIGNAWNKLPRLVRDLGHELGKKIDLVMRGAETELDRQVLELIKDPLTHMVRNSADHGLEGSEERRAAGKPETGRITLNAYHEGGHIIIEIADDGRGLSIERIRAKAQALGLASEVELAAMSERQIQRFIFHAGFSTAAAITAVSGRGVGMDVVKTNIERIGGTIDLKSTQGAGTIFTIKIPLTLAIVAALIVEAGGERFAIPQISVVELVRAGLAGEAASDQPVIERINETPVLRLRDRLLPLVNLRELLGLGAAVGVAREFYIVIAQVGSSLIGVIVDRVFDTEEIVVKPVAPILRHITMFSGNTILGDGSVIMILDPNGVARASGSAGNGESRKPLPATAETMTSAARTAMLLFRVGESAPKAVPLGLIARLEDIPRERIETSSGQAVMQYRGRLMPLIPFASATLAGESQAVLVFSDGTRFMGLMVDEIVDVMDEVLHIELGTETAGLLGSAVIGGRATDVIDTDYWLRLAYQDWFRAGHDPHPGALAPHLLLVEDSEFFRQLLVPVLVAAGYRVSAVESAAQALRLRAAGTRVDAIISDIVMPDMDGRAFARAIREDGAWRGLPLIAFSGRAEPADIAASRQAGFTEHIAKSERDKLLATLRDQLAPVGVESGVGAESGVAP
jgi:two-component system chemotaxis sensor kinase CheA